MESQKNIKRQRSKNFTPEEENKLIALVEEKKNITENKKSDAVTWKQKEQAWSSLAVTYATDTGIYRTSQALKAKYESLKKISKKEFAEEKRETFRTGGGPPVKHFVSSASEKIIEMIGESATGGDNLFDSDAIFDSIIVEEESDKEPEYMEVVDLDVANSPKFENKWTPLQLKKPVSKKLTTKRNFEKQKVEGERLGLIRAQRIIYEDENSRAEKKHAEEMEGLQVKRQRDMKSIELLELQIAEMTHKNSK